MKPKHFLALIIIAIILFIVAIFIWG